MIQYGSIFWIIFPQIFLADVCDDGYNNFKRSDIYGSIEQ